jgi:nitrate/TMAO reductase-like tetraheme cytochrome c subunit
MADSTPLMRRAKPLSAWHMEAMRWLTAGMLCFAAGCASDPSNEPQALSREQLMDPETCADCHAEQYREWSGSMHAYASDDPVFLAMNARGQREAGIGDFCVNCHAPMAVREGATTDGSNLAELPRSLQGVTCYFCHTAEAVEGTHNNPIRLARDELMRGSIADPVAIRAHGTRYSPLLDRDRLESSELCGSCHDVHNQHGTRLERTYEEWRESVFSSETTGTTCGQCHMPQSREPKAIASGQELPLRRTHHHGFFGVDLALTDFPEREAQERGVQEALDSSLQRALCVKSSGDAATVLVILDNVAAGHSFPSGAAQDRRLWVELSAYAGDRIIYRSGHVPQGESVTRLDDPDLWLIRDCMFDAEQKPVHMFWEARSVTSNLLPAPVTLDPADPRYYRRHVVRSFPSSSRERLPGQPDRVTLDIWLQPIGLDVLDEVVESGDLDESIRDAMPTLRVGPRVEWTPEDVTQSFIEDGQVVTCVSPNSLDAAAARAPGTSQARCEAPPLAP